MATESKPKNTVDLAPILERLRATLNSVGIALSPQDYDQIAESGMLRPVASFERLVLGKPVDVAPDYRADWGESVPATTLESQPHQAAAPQDSIAAIAAEIRAGKVSPVELTEKALERIAARDPELNAFQVVLADRARAAARRAEDEIRAGNWRGPLHGVPVAVKDLLAVAGTPTSAGAKVLADRVAEKDGTAVERLEAAGAVIVGKTRMSELAYSPGSNNDHFGPTRNPRNLERDAGGSSSGSGAAVADGLVYAALGTDTGGSIRIPAAFCGIVGLKPTFGRVSLHGGASLSFSQDHLGPMTRTVLDAGIVLGAIAGHDPLDPRTRRASDLDAALQAWARGEPETGIKGLRIGALREDGSGKPLALPDVLAGWRAGLDALARAGAEIIEIDVPALHPLRTLANASLHVEAAAYHLPRMRERLADFGEFTRLRLLSGFAFDATTFVRAAQLQQSLRREAGAIFEKVDLLSTPAVFSTATPLGTPSRINLTAPFNFLGWPALSVPCGRAPDGLPLALQLVGRPWDEATVLRAGLALEAAGL